MDFNPVLSEIHGLSDAAKGALGMAGHTLPSPESVAAAQAPSVLPPGMLLPHPENAPLPGNITMPGVTPMLPPSQQPTVTAPRGTIEGDTNARGSLLGQKAGVENIAHDVEGSRLGEAHPLAGKLLGGLAEGAGMVGDTLLHSAAPGIERMVPGTEGNYTRNLGRANTALTQDTENAQKEAQAASENATAGKTNAETPEVVPEAEARIGAENAAASEAPSAIAEHNAQAANLLHPQAKTDFEAWQQQNPGKPIEDWLKAQKANAPGNDFEQYYKDYLANGNLTDTAQNRVAAREKWAEASQAPQRAPIVNMFVPAAGGGETLQTVRPGQTVAPGAQTSAGVNAVNTPTTQQRTAAGRAETVVAMAPEVLARIDALTPKLGPLEGRWNDFMQGKVGGDDPDFAALRSDLLMMSSAVALAHAQGRLPENLREEFDNAINSPKQTPANLKATINTMLPWLEQMQKQGQPNAPQGSAPAAENWVRGPDGKLVKQ